MNVRQFELELDREWAAALEDVHEAVSLIGLTAFRGVVLKSPVDKGRFKGNWNLAIGSMDASTTEAVDPAGGQTINRAAGAISAYSAIEGFPVINITNALPYAERLEDGYSAQAPGGMVGLTVAEIQAQFDGMDV